MQSICYAAYYIRQEVGIKIECNQRTLPPSPTQSKQMCATMIDHWFGLGLSYDYL